MRARKPIQRILAVKTLDKRSDIVHDNLQTLRMGKAVTIYIVRDARSYLSVLEVISRVINLFEITMPNSAIRHCY